MRLWNSSALRHFFVSLYDFLFEVLLLVSGTQNVLPCHPDEVGKAKLLLFEELDLSEDYILLGGHLVIHHDGSVEVIGVLLLDLELHLLREVFNPFRQFKLLGVSQLGVEQLNPLAHHQSFFLIDLLYF